MKIRIERYKTCFEIVSKFQICNIFSRYHVEKLLIFFYFWLILAYCLFIL